MSELDNIITEETSVDETPTDEIAVADSILGSMKKALNIPQEVTDFDIDLVMHINAIFVKLNQMGVGPQVPFSISDNSSTWGDFSSDPMARMVQTYMYLELRLVFDPPTASVLTSMEKLRDEAAWRLNVACDELIFAGVGENDIEGEEVQNGL